MQCVLFVDFQFRLNWSLNEYVNASIHVSTLHSDACTWYTCIYMYLMLHVGLKYTPRILYFLKLLKYCRYGLKHYSISKTFAPISMYFHVHLCCTFLRLKNCTLRHIRIIQWKKTPFNSSFLCFVNMPITQILIGGNLSWSSETVLIWMFCDQWKFTNLHVYQWLI